MTWSLSCALAEALLLNRTLVLPDALCCHPYHCGGSEWCAPTRDFFALDGPHVALEEQLRAAGIQPLEIGCNMTRSAAAEVLPHVVAIQYATGCTRFYYQRCEANNPMGGVTALERPPAALAPLQAPRSVLSAADAIVAAVAAEASRSGSPSYCLHVRRGDKVHSNRWPCLAVDTSPASIERTLVHRVGVSQGALLYIASNEDDADFFRPLNRTFRVVTLRDFASYVSSAGPHGAVSLDYSICSRMPAAIETFNNLTTDAKDGCSVPRRRHGNEDSRCSPRYECMSPGQWSDSPSTYHLAVAPHSSVAASAQPPQPAAVQLPFSALVISSSQSRFDRAAAEVRRAGFTSVAWVPAVFGSKETGNCSVANAAHPGPRNVMHAHLDAMRHIVDSNLSMAIFEDDATFLGGASSAAADMTQCDADSAVLWLGWLSTLRVFTGTHAIFYSPYAARVASSHLQGRCVLDHQKPGVGFDLLLHDLCIGWKSRKKFRCRKSPPFAKPYHQVFGNGHFGQDRRNVAPLLHDRHNRLLPVALEGGARAAETAKVDQSRPPTLVVVFGRVRSHLDELGREWLRTASTTLNVHVAAVVVVTDAQSEETQAARVRQLHGAYRQWPLFAVRWSTMAWPETAATLPFENDAVEPAWLPAPRTTIEKRYDQRVLLVLQPNREPLPLPMPLRRAVPFLLIVSCRNCAVQRHAIRTSWLPHHMPNPYAFLVGGAAAEQQEEDIVHLTASDEYGRLGDKVRAGFQWAATNANYTHLVKIDDDTFVNPSRLMAWLRHVPLMRFYCGFVLVEGAVVMRAAYVEHWPKGLRGMPRMRGKKESLLKWAVPNETYSALRYPSYALGGGYVLSADAVRSALSAWEDGRAPIIANVEDAMVGVAMHMLGVPPRHEPGFSERLSPTPSDVPDAKSSASLACCDKLVFHRPVSMCECARCSGVSRRTCKVAIDI